MLSIALALSVLAADSGDVVYRKHTVVDFGDDTIEGDLSTPDGVVTQSATRRKHVPLIKLRDNFRAEILATHSST